MIEVHLFGRLRQYGPTKDPTIECVLRAEIGEEHQTVGSLIASLGIPSSEVASVFLDGHWMSEGVDAHLGAARRLGLFPPNMSLLYV